MIKRSKKGQVAVFIIIGVVVVGAVLFFALRDKIPGMAPTERQKVDVDECISDIIKDALRVILPQGGVLHPTNYQSYKGAKVPFFCYTNQFYERCITQISSLDEEVVNSLKEYAGSRIEDCFYAVEQEYKDRGYDVRTGDMTFDIKIDPSRIVTTVEKDMIFTKDTERIAYKEFKVNTISELFNLLLGVHDVLDQEAKFCEFNYINYDLIHPEFNVERATIGTEVKIYKIKATKTGEEVSLAVRSCAYPPNAF